MPSENALLMKQAREALDGKWGIAVGCAFLFTLVTVLVGEPDGVGPLLGLLIDGPMLLGLSVFSLSLARKQEVTISQLFSGFNDFLRALKTYLLMLLFIILWTLLLIIPGIIATYAYSQTFFILAEDKTISAREALRKSKAMMYGHKKELFFLNLRFIGWLMLSALTLGIGLLWLMPYFHTTMALFYDKLAGKNVLPNATS